MHAGNIFASLISWIVAKRSGGDVVLRIEDLDPDRSKQEFTDQIQKDYEWLGLGWDRGPYYQSQRQQAYQAAFEELVRTGNTYPCFCSRADIKHATQAPHPGEKRVYPGTCFRLTEQERNQKVAEFRARGRKPSIRLHVPQLTIQVHDMFQGTYSQRLDTECGDFLVQRSDGAFAYQLAVVVDDAAMGVNFVVRGVDLLPSTPQQMYLQDLFGFPHPGYGHVPLLVAEKNRRLSKRDHDAGLDKLKESYQTPEGILGHIAYVAGIIPTEEPQSADQLLRCADLTHLEHTIQILWH